MSKKIKKKEGGVVKSKDDILSEEHERLKESFIRLAGTEEGKKFFSYIFRECGVLTTTHAPEAKEEAYREGFCSVYLAVLRPFIRKSKYLSEIERMKVETKDYQDALVKMAKTVDGIAVLHALVNSTGVFRVSAHLNAESGYDPLGTEYNIGRKSVYLNIVRPMLEDLDELDKIERPEVN